MKMHLTQFTGGFAYEFPRDSGEYKKVIISAHPDHKFKRTYDMPYNEYQSYGECYSYDGRSYTLDGVLEEYDPESQGVDCLINLLRANSSLEKYETTWENLTRWADEITRYTQGTVGTLGSLFFGYNTLKRIEF